MLLITSLSALASANPGLRSSNSTLSKEKCSFHFPFDDEKAVNSRKRLVKTADKAASTQAKLQIGVQGAPVIVQVEQADLRKIANNEQEMDEFASD